MPRVTYKDFQNSRIPAAAGQCPNTPKLLAWLNEAQERLLYEGKWWGTFARLRICADSGCITLPPQIATIEAVAICGRPIVIRDNWFEFLENGMGLRNECSCWPECLARGEYPTFTDITGTDKKLLFLCDLTADVGKQVLALGYDANGNWIRTQQNGDWQDGELITLSQSPGTQSVNLFTSLTGVQLPSDMKGQTWLYSYSTTDTTLIMLGHYQYFETNPSYARYFVPRLNSCIKSQSAGSCNKVQVEMVGKMAFIPTVNPSDYLIIPCLPALKEMIIAIKNAENEGDGQKANAILATGMGLAKAILDKQLNHQLGDGTQIGITIQGSGGAGGDEAVSNFI